ncbi:MAG: carboxypeptidase-like regulatory domain-containing protein [Flavobacteriaceae bacterium]
MKFFLLFYQLFSVFLVFSQTKTFTVKSDDPKISLAYSTIQVIGKQVGFYTDSEGKFILPDGINYNDSIQISYVGYKTVKLKVEQLTETIVLMPKTEILDEILIEHKHSRTVSIGLANKKTKLTWHIRPKAELSTLIKNEKYIPNSYIEKIHIPIDKGKLIKVDGKIEMTYPNFESVFRVHLYSIENNKPKMQLLNYPVLLYCNQDSDNVLTVDISNEHIEFPQEGIFIGVEMIGDKAQNYSNENKLEQSTLPSFRFTKKAKKNLDLVSYSKNIFFEDNWTSINNSNEFSYLKNEYHMAVGLTLRIYED